MMSLRPADLPPLEPLSEEVRSQAVQWHVRLRAHTGDWGEWAGGHGSADGVTSWPYVVLGPLAEQTMVWLLSVPGLTPTFAWPAWQAARDLPREAIGDLEPDIARALLTVHVRQQRFVEGTLLRAFADGVMTDLIGVLARPTGG